MGHARVRFQASARARGGQEAHPPPGLCSRRPHAAHHPSGSPSPGDTPLMSYDQQYSHESELPARAVQLNHTIVYASDRHRSAEFIATILGLQVGAPFGPFLPVDLGNGVTLDYYEKRDEPIHSQHYAFLVPDAQFD